MIDLDVDEYRYLVLRIPRSSKRKTVDLHIAYIAGYFPRDVVEISS